MDIGNRFSLEDFLAYFFPGVTGSLGIYALLQLTSLKAKIPPLTFDVTTAIIFFVLSYIVGIIFSSFAEVAFAKIKGYKNIIPLNNELKKIVIDTFRDVFKIPKNTDVEWSKDHFYLCRSLVYERMPSILPLLQRQSSLRQLRINLLPALFMWCIAGIVWGIQNILQNALISGLIIIALSILAYALIFAITINRAKSNEWREVREVLTAFSASYRKNREKDKAELPKT